MLSAMKTSRMSERSESENWHKKQNKRFAFFVKLYYLTANEPKTERITVMKKALIAITLCCAAILPAKDIKDYLDTAKIGAAMIPNWTVNKSSKAADYGKTQIVVGSEADEKALKVTAPADRGVAVYMLVSTPVNAGEFLEYSAKVKGKGQLTLSFYTYNAKDQYVGGVKIPNKTFVLTDTWTEIKCKFPVKDSAASPVGRIRPCFTLTKGGELLIEDIDLELDKD